MKTSTMLFLGGAAALAYYLYQKQNPLTGATTGSVLTHGANPPTAAVTSPPFVSPDMATAVMAPPVATTTPEDDYSDIVPLSYGWSMPAYGARAWSCGGGGRRHGGRGGHR